MVCSWKCNFLDIASFSGGGTLLNFLQIESRSTTSPILGRLEALLNPKWLHETSWMKWYRPGFSPSSFGFPPLLFIPPVFCAHLSSPSELCDGTDCAAHYHFPSQGHHLWHGRWLVTEEWPFTFHCTYVRLHGAGAFLKSWWSRNCPSYWTPRCIILFIILIVVICTENSV